MVGMLPSQSECSWSDDALDDALDDDSTSAE